ncbi:hypothetical protein A3K55_00710 [Candidatus Shapirobacteria bacterium RBG_13_44_7]|uniref:M23ase beta-sheet core domain-containing protein n=1 Tax=Candidatus Shapirobacteria bacterium RBG_13_44_7 TaxID=1802149 RepID=A0A1F7SEV5_9BACT|nr:MAG: hypothetical protein A3K55_00710 [Candidatus Shapirobacteria bacterium RBG_13_44_7]
MTLLILVLLSLLWRPNQAAALSCSDPCTDPDACQQVINECTSRLDTLAKSKDTLSNQIKILTSQVELTLLKINQTEVTIKNLIKEIEDLTQKINTLDVDLNQLSSTFIELTAKNYKLNKSNIGLYQLFLSGFDNYIHQYKYLTVIQKEIRNSLLNLETARTNYDIQKEEKKKKQSELDSLQKRLSEQKTSLARQKESKISLLEVTKNDEKRYQQLRAAAENELKSLLQAKFVGKRAVKKGEAVGLMGNTGYSFGDHLHFGLYNLAENDLSQWSYPNDVDPTDYLKSHLWPMNDPIEITQGRGHTKYSYLYSDRFHHGIDLVSPNKTIRAIEDGVAYFYRNAESSLGNHIKIFHSDGKMSLYLHLQ